MNFVNMLAMTDREERILDAAKRVFARYGVERTTMSDIASEAGVSRQTLYNTFTNKADIVRGAIRQFMDTTVARLEKTLPELSDLDTQIDEMFRLIVIEPYDQIAQSSYMEDLFALIDEAAKEEMASGQARFRALYAKVLAPHEAALQKSGLSVEGYADYLQRASHNMKHAAVNAGHLRELLATLRRSTVALTTDRAA